MFALPNAPQTIGQTLDTGFKLYFKSFSQVILFSLIMNTISVSLGIAFGYGSVEEPVSPADITMVFILVILILLVSIVFQIAIIRRIHSITEGDAESMSDSFTAGLKLFLPYLGATILYSMVVGLGLVLLIIPGIVLAIYLFLYGVAMVTEGAGVMDSLQRSLELVKQNWWRSMVILSVVSIVYGILYSVAAVVLGVSMAFQEFTDITQIQFWADIINAAIGTIVWPLVTAMMIVLYNDLRLRREGGDLEARLNEMD